MTHDKEAAQAEAPVQDDATGTASTDADLAEAAACTDRGAGPVRTPKKTIAPPVRTRSAGAVGVEPSPDVLDAVPADLNEASDELLLALIAREASRAAFVVLFDRYAGRVKAFLIRSGASQDEAEEGAQEVMVTLWRQARQFNAARAGASTWIYTIARNKRIDMLRRARRPEPDPSDPLFAADPAASAETDVAADQRDGRVRRALQALSEDQLAVVRLSFFAGLSQSEIAERLGTPLGTVKSRLRLSFQRLRETLGEEFHGELLDE
ncbi:MAG: sigma-70 family RNA polymerase sigma factor [Pseudomonadota bacterium]